MKYAAQQNLAVSPDEYTGLRLEDLIDVEKTFDVKIDIFSLQSDLTCNIVWSSGKTKGKMLNLNLYDERFSLITCMDQ